MLGRPGKKLQLYVHIYTLVFIHVICVCSVAVCEISMAFLTESAPFGNVVWRKVDLLLQACDITALLWNWLGYDQAVALFAV